MRIFSPRATALAVAALALLVLAGAPARAQVFDLAPPGKPPVLASNVGDARSFIFDALSPFSLNSVGIRMDPLVAAFSLQAQLFAVTPGTLNRVGVPLATSALQAFTDNGLTFYDIAFPVALAGGLRYELEVAPTGGFGLGLFNVEFYNYAAPGGGGGSDPPYTVGPLSVIDGAGAGVGGPGNSALAHFRVNVTQGSVIPEPGTYALLASGLLPLAGSLRRHRRRRSG